MSVRSLRAWIVAATLGGAILVSGAAQAAESVSVDARDDIFLAGQSSVPSGFGYNPAGNSIYADDYNGAGLLPVAVGVSGGEVLTLTATGQVSCCYGGSPSNGPNGGGLGGDAIISGYGNVGAYNDSDFLSGHAPELALVGVFNGAATPWSIFVIGSSDTFTVPTGATELYLGVPDALGFNDAPGWYNDNTGAFTVDISVPEPATWAMMLVGFFGVGFMVRSRRQLQGAAVA